MRRYVAQRQMLPDIAATISSSVGMGLFARSGAIGHGGRHPATTRTGAQDPSPNGPRASRVHRPSSAGGARATLPGGGSEGAVEAPSDELGHEGRARDRGRLPVVPFRVGERLIDLFE